MNAYIKEVSGGDFTAKDFRTWVGTVSAVRALRELAPEDADEIRRLVDGGSGLR